MRAETISQWHRFKSHLQWTAGWQRQSMPGLWQQDWACSTVSALLSCIVTVIWTIVTRLDQSITLGSGNSAIFSFLSFINKNWSDNLKKITVKLIIVFNMAPYYSQNTKYCWLFDTYRHRTFFAFLFWWFFPRTLLFVCPEIKNKTTPPPHTHTHTFQYSPIKYKETAMTIKEVQNNIGKHTNTHLKL